ncbi:hypothetical protein P7C71_g6156, partial [Lecanoromycetidae sp. Uapishka_2]
MATVSPLDSFQHLTDNLPTWLTKLDDLTVQVAEQNARFIRLSHSSVPMITKKKHNSTESLRPNDNVTEAHNENQKPEDGSMPPPPTDSEPLYIPPNPSYKCLSHTSRPKIAGQNNAQPPLIPQPNRKRKPTSTHPSAGSDHVHPRYRTKAMIVVYYDSAVQEAFEALVRSIAGARNTLRKGRTTASFKARMASMGMGSGDDPFTGPSEFAMLSPKMRGSFGRTGGLGLRDSPDSKMKEFDDADKDLETAQNLCEVAAHQFLRDGDCRHEIEGTRKRVEAVLEIATKEVDRLRVEDEKEKAEEAREAEKKTSSPDEDRSEEKVPEIDLVQEKTMAPEPVKQINFSGTGTIEIDDGSDAESVHIDISNFRNSIRARRA